MENQRQPPVLFGCLFFFLIITTIVYEFIPSNDTFIKEEQQREQQSPIVVSAEVIKEIVKKPKPFKPRYPHCLRNDSGELYDLVVNLVHDVTTCDPSKKTAREAQCLGEDEPHSRAIVVYTAVALLMVSLVAAAVEVYRHRCRPGSSPSGSTNSRDPPQLSRRCSLADLTVLRHNRRESMLRRDSSMHMSFEGSALPGNGAHQHRVPLKLLGSSKSQDDSSRRGSIAPAKTCKWQRSISADKADENIPDVHHHRAHLIRHH